MWDFVTARKTTAVLLLSLHNSLLLSQVHESGIGVQEEGMPAAQRVLISNVPEQAVFSLLQYLYTAKCSIPASLRPHVLELASRLVPSMSSVRDVLQFKVLGLTSC